MNLINVLIVHYNTPELTEACVKSINKHTPGCKIYIFDNSDKRPFTAFFDNVEIIDNTKGQIINFNKEIKKYPNRKNTIDNQGSAKHMFSVQYFFDNFEEPFILIDSDILAKTDISTIIDDKCVAKGIIEKPSGNKKAVRFAPYLLYVNLPVCKLHKITFYKENQIYKLQYLRKSLYYDTGASFFELCYYAQLHFQNINIYDYILHLGGASCTSIGKKDLNVWLEQNKDLWQ